MNDDDEIQALRAAITAATDHHDAWLSLIDELGAFRANARLAANSTTPAPHDDLPPDAPTGLYLDQPFDVDDLGWLKLMLSAYYSDSKRPAQIMLVFQAIRRDARAATEFIRVMNTHVLPLCRRIRLHEQPQLGALGAANGGSK